MQQQLIKYLLAKEKLKQLDSKELEAPKIRVKRVKKVAPTFCP